MLPTAIIVFREVLEAALVIGIVMAATKGVARRGWFVGGGIVAGVAGAMLVAAFASSIAQAAAGMGQEYLNAAVLFAAVAMLGWHNVWMGRHARELTAKVQQIGRNVSAGDLPLYALALVVGLAVLREGSEVVLFLYGIAAAEGAEAAAMTAGGIAGLIAGAAVGAAIYFGLLRIPTRHLFTVTGWMILLLAAGMAAQGAAFLTQAGAIPALGHAIWDTSAFLSERSLVGQILHTLVGYTARPSGVQLLFYGLTLVVIGGLSHYLGRQAGSKAGARAS